MTRVLVICLVVTALGCDAKKVTVPDAGPADAGLEAPDVRDASAEALDVGGETAAPDGAAEEILDSGGTAEAGSDSDSTADARMDSSADARGDHDPDSSMDGSPDGSVAGPAKFLGDWAFTSGRVFAECSDTSKDTRSLAGDHLEVTTGAAGTLVASFYCDWTLDLTPDGTTTVMRPNQSCTTTSMGTQFIWTGKTFTLTTLDGHSATLTAFINAAYSNPVTGSGTCTLDIMGVLSK